MMKLYHNHSNQITRIPRILLSLVFTLAAFGIHAQTLISTAQELYDIRNDLAGNYKLKEDINLADLIGTPVSPANGYEAGWKPVGIKGDPFTGSFDGGGFTIKGLWINLPFTDIVGLFGWVDTSGSIKDLTVEVAAGTNGVGIIGHWTVGALAGNIVAGTIENCSAVGGTVKGDLSIGGLIGNQKGTLTGCYATVNVESNGGAGGLVNAQYGTIDACFATGSVMSTGNNAGIGGLVGMIGGGAGPLTNSYATGSVTAKGNTAYIGGLVGTQQKTIENCYATGKVEANSSPRAGGLVGNQNNTPTLTTSYYNKETTGMVNGVGVGNEDGVTGLTTEEMIVADSYDWGIQKKGEGSPGEPWEIDERTYPYLYWQTSNIIQVPKPTPPVPPTPPTPPAPEICQVTIMGVDDPTLAGCITLYPGEGTHLVEKGQQMTVLVFLSDTCDQSDVKMLLNDTDTIIAEEKKQELRAIAYTFTFQVKEDNTEAKVMGVKLNNPIGNESVKAEGAKVWTTPGYIHVSRYAVSGTEHAESTKQKRTNTLRIYTISGGLVMQREIPVGTTTIPLEKGTYLVVVGDTVTKVVL